MSRTLLLAAAIGLTAAGAARAETVWIAGSSFTHQTPVAYAGMVKPLPGKRLADGWSQSLFTDYVSYEYDSGNRRIVGKVNGLKYAIGREFKLDSGMLGFSLGISHSKTRLNPDDLGNRSRGAQTRAVTELQWRSHDDASWQSRAYGQYVLGARRDISSFVLGRKLANGMRIGPQISSNGDPTYRVYGVALAMSGWKRGRAELGAFIGAQHAEGGKTRPEIGVSFVMYQPD